MIIVNSLNNLYLVHSIEFNENKRHHANFLDPSLPCTISYTLGLLTPLRTYAFEHFPSHCLYREREGEIILIDSCGKQINISRGLAVLRKERYLR